MIQPRGRKVGTKSFARITSMGGTRGLCMGGGPDGGEGVRLTCDSAHADFDEPLPRRDSAPTEPRAK